MHHAPIAIIDRLAAGLSLFLFQSYRPSLGGATRKRTALPPHAPSCNCGLAARGSGFPLSRLSVFVRRRYSKAHRAFSSRSALETHLAPGFVDGDGRAIGEVQGTQGRAHGQSHLLGHVRAFHDVHRVGDVAGLGAEQQDVGRLVFHLGVELGGMCGERDDARIGHGLHQVVEIRVQHHVGHVVVVEACSAQLGVAQVETQRLHQMQDGAGHRAQADGRAGVAGNTR